MMSKAEGIDRIALEAGGKDITVNQAGRRGGLETLRRHGREHFVSAGCTGQKAVACRYTTEDRRHWGSLGGRPRRVRLVDTGEKGQFK